jgi:organic radical activating enzyme
LIAKQYIDLGYSFASPPMIEFDRSGKDKILELITKSVNLSSIYLLGGEPLINEFHDEIIELLINTDKAKGITLHYSTNLHTDVEKHLERWSKFKLVEISVSIDNKGDTVIQCVSVDNVIRNFNNLSEVTICLGIFDKDNILHNFIIKIANSLSHILKGKTLPNLYKSVFVVVEHENNIVFAGLVDFNGL